MEVLIVDGCSQDGTRDIANAYSEKYPFIRLLTNEERTVPFAMNIGIAEASGEVIVRMDAHAVYPLNYIEVLVDALETYGADNVGGVWNTVPSSNAVEAQVVAAILSHSFGVGNALYRTGLTEPRVVDTVPFGCYRRDVFDRIGLYDEMLTRNQDDEINARLVRHGGKIVLLPNVVITYFARESLLKMAKMLYQYAYFKPLVNLKVGRATTIRQLIPPIFLGCLILSAVAATLDERFLAVFVGILSLHMLVGVYVSWGISKIRSWKLFPLLPVGFLLAHLSYGFGYLRGLMDFLILRKHKQARIKIGLSR